MELGTVAVLGAGNMARAVVLGLIEAPDIEAVEIRTTNQSSASAARWSDQPGVVAYAIEDQPDANRTATDGADLILIGVEPQGVRALLADIADLVGPETVVVSLAAGVSLDAMAALLPAGTTIVRTAPNTPSLVRAGVTGLTMVGGDDDVRTLVSAMFAIIGIVVWVEEDVLPFIGSFSGPAPAYFYFLVEQFAKAGEGRGISREQSEQLATASFLGSAALLQATGLPPAELRREVMTPGGATEQAIKVLTAAELDQTFGRAIDAAVTRINEMGAGG